MSYDEDYKYALELQKRINGDIDDGNDSDIECIDFKKPLKVKRSNPRSNLDEDYLNRTQNLVHPQWETLDPTPDVFALFSQFDGKFFQGRLKCVTLEWSKKMYSCAGICYSRKNRYGMDVTIRLSEPLLKLRPRKDLVETMLHEMIHAYCFVLNIREGNGGHGPQFKKIMYAINKVAGTNITVYHTFHDEVDLYKQHWWRCNGVCQDRSPFFGYVKRTSNRAPGPNDIWWAKHQQECGGTFMKIKEPEKSQKRKASKKSEKENKNDLRKFFTPQPKPGAALQQPINSIKNLDKNFKENSVNSVKGNGGGTLLVNPRTKPTSTSSISKAFPPTSYPGFSTDPFSVPSKRLSTGGNLRNVVSFTNLINGKEPTETNKWNWGTGNTLSATSTATDSKSSFSNNTEQQQVNRQQLREVWEKRFKNNDRVNKDAQAEEEEDKTSGDTKRRRISISEPSDVIRVNEDESLKDAGQKDWLVIDDDVMLQQQSDDIIAISSGEDSNDSDYESVKSTIHKDMTFDERQSVIKKEIIEDSIDLSDNDIELIDDEYDDKLDHTVDLTAAIELADTSVIDEFFGEDTLLKEFRKENDLIASGSRYQFNPNNDIITCPICQSKMARSTFSEHLNGCTGIAVKIEPPKRALKKLAAISKEVRPKKNSRPSRQATEDILRSAGYSETDWAQIDMLSSTDETDDDNESLTSTQRNSLDEDNHSRRYRQRSIYKTTRQCHLCGTEVEETDITEHMIGCRKTFKK